MEIAVLIPCYNEEKTISKVIEDFKKELPKAKIYVYDNNSTDDTFNIAVASGAIVRKENRQGKGNVVRSMFRDINADCYILVDGDDTYPASSIHALIQPVMHEKVDMVIGDRLSNGTYFNENKRNFHNFGNSLVKSIVNWVFRSQLQDIMTGYRVFSKAFVKNFPILTSGFQLETEMSVFALNYNFKVKEIAIDYRDRPVGSVSKLNTFQDGYRVLKLLGSLFKHSRPLLFFSIISGLLAFASILVGSPVIIEYFTSRYISHIPLAILASGLAILASIFYMVGLILETLVYYNRQSLEIQINQFINDYHD